MSTVDLLIDDATLPQFWFLTVTFLPVEAKRDDHISHPTSSLLCPLRALLCPACLKADEQFRTQEMAAAPDLPLHRLPVHQAREDVRYALTNRAISRNPFHFYPEHPETTPHIHSIMLVAPQLVERFKAIRASLANLFQSLGPANCTLRTASLQTRDDLRRAIFYSSKLLKQPPRSLSDIDLYTVLPKAKSEPVYVKSDWERELEAALRESRASSANV